MVSIKNANLSKDHGIDPTVAYIDIRAGGKNYEEYYKRIRQSGVKFIRSKISQIREDKETKNLKVLIDEDITYGMGRLSELTFDMVVISTAMAPSIGQDKLVERLNITSGPNGFLDEYHSRLNPVDTRIPGISLAGASQAPKSIAETIMQAKGTSSSMGKLINVGKYSIELIRALHDVDSCCKCQNCLKVCPFHAISINKEGNIEVDEILCTGCGLCVSVCPNEAITVRYYRDEQFNQQIDAFLDNL
jgi:heterodisulfide reductase subunit A